MCYRLLLTDFIGDKIIIKKNAINYIPTHCSDICLLHLRKISTPFLSDLNLVVSAGFHIKITLWVI